ncbi:hypothetical protein CVT24_000529 [Panaeolus cyanescens]|uniref:Uncharacterized protein n=1 Tax=Panaeolus cyanescens TaxID=181874 RepID=A0A409VCN0_9AGAR|nr:hypothetical protein CVT24_000529 [Panaeolus cyanescens]
MSSSPASIDAEYNSPNVVCRITYTPLDSQSIIASVQDDGAGATAVFIGTTRNSFKSKVVTRLEYQAYSKLAIKTMTDIANLVMQNTSRSQHQPEGQCTPAIIKCAIHHRLGTVPVGEPSIVIAVSSPHRKEAFDACEEILEQVKKKAQIWKREYYEGEDDANAEWKTNA